MIRARPSSGLRLFTSLLLPFLLTLLSLQALAPLARAQTDPLADRVAALAEGGYGEKVTAVDALAATGDPRAVPILEAMMDRNLFQRRDTKSVVIAERAEKFGYYQLIDPLTLEPTEIVPRQLVAPIRVNNRVRAAIRGAIGNLQLLHPDPAQRLAAAEAVYTARDATAVPALRAAIDKETDPEIEAVMRKALAAAQIAADDPAQKLEAIAYLARHPTPEVRSMLAGLLVQRDGTYAEPDADVRAAAAKALDDIERRLALWAFVENVYRGFRSDRFSFWPRSVWPSPSA